MSSEGRLKIKIQEAADILAPKFGISSEMLEAYGEPSCHVADHYTASADTDPLRDSMAGYKKRKKEFLFYPDAVNDAAAIGEETSHYLHSVINPFEYVNPFERGIFKQVSGINIGKFWKIRNAEELIGRYGAHIYARETGAEIMSAEELRANWDASFSAKPGKFDELSRRERMAFYDYMGHRDGYLRADVIFSAFGDALLPSLARLSPEDAVEIYSRLVPVTFFERNVLPWIDAVRKRKLIIANENGKQDVSIR